VTTGPRSAPIPTICKREKKVQKKRPAREEREKKENPALFIEKGVIHKWEKGKKKKGGGT